jgi:hypothetical protein
MFIEDHTWQAMMTSLGAEVFKDRQQRDRRDPKVDPQSGDVVIVKCPAVVS